jgi:hypothetical protein
MITRPGLDPVSIDTGTAVGGRAGYSWAAVGPVIDCGFWKVSKYLRPEMYKTIYPMIINTNNIRNICSPFILRTYLP